MNIFQVPNTFMQISVNPFHNDKPYTEDWTLIRLIERAGTFQQRTRPANKGQIFQFEITKELADWKYRIGDFIQYESDNNKNIIVAINEQDLLSAKSGYASHRYNDPFLRSYEQKILVHTTTKENYEKIISSGELKCWNLCKAENADWESKPIGALSNDPANYSDYIMFGTGGVLHELIPLCKQRGFIDMNLDSTYTAGARFYFSAEKVANDGLLIRDGVHLKVKHRLPFNPYLLWIATPMELGIPEQTTPRKFAEMSDRIFSEKFGIIPKDIGY